MSALFCSWLGCRGGIIYDARTRARRRTPGRSSVQDASVPSAQRARVATDRADSDRAREGGGGGGGEEKRGDWRDRGRRVATGVAVCRLVGKGKREQFAVIIR